MTIGRLLTERGFLINNAVTLFNEQYGKNIRPEDCSIVSIAGNYQCKYGYEIRTFWTDDAVRLRMYFNIQGIDNFLPYRVEVDREFIQGALGDEVYVTIGTINPYYRDNGIYKFRPLDDGGVMGTNTAYFVSGEPIQFMNGEYLTWVGGNK